MTKRNNKNALKHGVFSGTVVLPGEDANEFEELHKSLIDEWYPNGLSEHDRVLNLACNYWRKRRLRRFRKNEIARLGGKSAKMDERDRFVVEALMKTVDPATSEQMSEFEEYIEKERLKCNSKNSNVEENNFSDEVFAQDLALEELIDAKIDKDIMALGKIKTMKEMIFANRSVSVATQPMKQLELQPAKEAVSV